jgi:hypothetical protein
VWYLSHIARGNDKFVIREGNRKFKLNKFQCDSCIEIGALYNINIIIIIIILITSLKSKKASITNALDD